MKFYTVMNRTFKVLFLILFVNATWNSFSQKITNSPYSVFGLGELNSGEYAYFMGQGNAFTACTDSTIVNQNNPASYAGIDRFRPIFQIGLNGRFSQLSTTTQSTTQRQFNFNQFQLGIPIKKNWGASFGLSPYSSTGYTITNSNFNANGDTLSQFINEGSGTVSKMHIGLGYKHTIGKKSRLFIGANANYLFGSSQKIQSFEYYQFPSGGLHSRVINTTRIGSFIYDIGMIFDKQFYRNSMSIGFNYSPSMEIKSNQDLLAFSYSQSFYDNFSYPFVVLDTIEYINNNSGKIYIPESYNFGFEYRFKACPTSAKTYQLKLSTDIRYQKWSDYYEEFNGSRNDSMFNDRMGIFVGLQYSPSTGRNMNTINTPYLGRIHYRLGVNYTLSHIFVNETQLTDYGISFGLGLPIVTGNSNTNINFGVNYRSFGTT